MSVSGPALVLVAVGTDVHPFTRLVGWADQLAARLDGAAEVVLQHGQSQPGRLATARDYLGYEELEQLMRRAGAVVTHGGPGSIMGARDAGHRPIVVPRDPALGEHVDDHQQRFTDLLVSEGRVVRADDYPTLERQVLTALAEERRLPVAAMAVAPGVTAAGRVLDDLLSNRPRRRWRR